ncbi:MAG: NAD-dependent epimerase/dehydratase family protein [Candidatus Latescibacteria bacterium]|nr:NAD-dependent epimerase/dehydratase family protein [Candidatus Latescibacterota bacterium]
MGILITGGTGFTGAETARLLLQEGAEGLVLFDINTSTQRLDDLADLVEVRGGDLGNFSHVLEAVQRARPRTIYHLGGMLSLPSEDDPPAAFRANAMGTFHVLEAARLLGVEQVVFASTIGYLRTGY